MAEPKQTNKERLREITESIEQGIKEVFESDKYMEYLRVMSRFHSYSQNNVMLIKMQMPGATRVAGFNKWRDQFGRHVKRGERSIKIIAPTPYKKKIEEVKRDPDTKAPILDKDGKAILEEKEVQIPMFKVVSVFDVSQTEGKPLPQLASDLIGNVQDYEIFMEALRRASPVPMEIKPIRTSEDGYFDPDSQSITLREGMSEVQTVCAGIHEIAHAKLHNYEKERLAAVANGEEPPKPKDRNTEEVEAESISYVVCQYYGIQTSENSFGYIASWSSGKELPELKASLNTIQKTASGLITDIDRHFLEICKERGIDLSKEAEQEVEAVMPMLEVKQELHRYYITKEALQKGTYPLMEGSQVTEQTELHPYEKGRIEAYGYIDYPKPLTQEQIDESGLVPAELAATLSAERLFVLDDAVYLHLQTSENGYDYTLYDVNTLRELDGGQLDAPEISIFTACLQIGDMHGFGEQSIKYAPTSMIETLQEAAQEQMQSEVAQWEADHAADISVQTVDTSTQTVTESEITAEELAVAIDNFSYDYDTYEYRDRVEDREQAVEELLQSIQSGDVSSIREWLQEIAEEDEILAIKIQAQELINRLEHFVGIEGRDALVEASISDPETASPSMLPDAPEQALDEYPMPDETLTVAALEACGYMDGDMLPLSKEQAMELFDKELTVYSIVDGGNAEMLFDREDFDTQAPAVLFAVSREEWEQSPMFHEKVMERLSRQEEREAAFLAHEGDCFAIYQVTRDDPNNVRFMNMDWMQSHGLAIDRANYDLIYTAPLTAEGSTPARLEGIFEQFNIRRPADYHFPSLSVSDIVAVKENGVVSCHYCDSVGFQELSGFLPQDNPLRNAEMAMEDDYGMIDGIINNGPKEPSVAELEKQARSGQPISLMDLAEAVHREQREKKKSVVEQLKTKPKQEHKKTAPKKSAEREI